MRPGGARDERGDDHQEPEEPGDDLVRRIPAEVDPAPVLVLLQVHQLAGVHSGLIG